VPVVFQISVLGTHESALESVWILNAKRRSSFTPRLSFLLFITVAGEVNGLCVHSMRATAATNALSNQADMAKVQGWPDHANGPLRGFTTGARASRRAPRHFT
jgi:hypothetical protein